jgi:hypothetical protein
VLPICAPAPTDPISMLTAPLAVRLPPTLTRSLPELGSPESLKRAVEPPSSVRLLAKRSVPAAAPSPGAMPEPLAASTLPLTLACAAVLPPAIPPPLPSVSVAFAELSVPPAATT